MKKGPAKKKAAPTPTSKRKYTKRVKEKNNTGGGDSQLFKIEPYVGPLRLLGFATTEQYVRLQETIKKLKPGEGFVMLEEWRRFAHKTVRDLQLNMKIQCIRVAGNDKHVRVIRLY